MSVARSLADPSWAHPFGTDELGRDLFSRTAAGIRVSVEIALLTAVIGGLVGSAIGLIAGYFEGWRDATMMRGMDFLLGFPSLVLAMTMAAIIGPGTLTPALAAIIVTVPLFARVVRAATLTERKKEYVLAARAMGSSDKRILVRTLFPAIWPVILVQAAIAGALAVQLEAALSFLGLGIRPPAPSLGGMLQTARGYLYNYALYGVFPGVLLTLLVGSLIVLSNALQAREDVDLSALASAGNER